MKKTFYLIGLLLLASSALWAQTSKEEVFATIEKSGGVYYAYPEHEIKDLTPNPKGYKPFYISHFGRHGSRYLIGDNDYKWVLDLFADASQKKALTPLGEDVYGRLQKVWLEADGRGGDLTPLGVRQQRNIAERMFRSFPEVFTDNVKMEAHSTMVMRCAMTMDAFSERLKELNPKLEIKREASERHVRYLNHHTKEAIDFRTNDWKEEYRKFEEAHTKPERLISTLFSDKKYVTERVHPHNTMWGLYWIASDMQNMETDLSFYDLFEKQELMDLWQSFNYRFYVADGPSAKSNGIMDKNAIPLMKNIMERADEAIKDGTKGGAFRFGHDGNIVPLIGFMRIENCYNSVSEPTEFYKAWSDFKVAPMAANVQLVFFKKDKSDDILVKILHNGNEVTIPPVKSDILPYYHWTDLKGYYYSLIEKLLK